MRKSGIIFILSAPSGGGKTTLTRGLLEIIPNLLLSISVTTRPPRLCEFDGRDYFFKTIEEFSENIKEDQFLEYASIYGNYYGTLKRNIYEPLAKNIDILFDIDWQGARAIKEKVTDNKIVSIFILPPSLEILKQRLIFRDQDTNNIINQRYNLVSEEIKYAKEYDYIVINNDLSQALEELKSIIIAERIKNSNLEKLKPYL